MILVKDYDNDEDLEYGGTIWKIYDDRKGYVGEMCREPVWLENGEKVIVWSVSDNRIGILGHYPPVHSLVEMIDWVADWLRKGMPCSGFPQRWDEERLEHLDG